MTGGGGGPGGGGAGGGGGIGDVMLWHASLAHCASSNANRGEPRAGCFLTWHHTDVRAEPGVKLDELESESAGAKAARVAAQPRYAVPRDMWEMWSAETRAVRRQRM